MPTYQYACTECEHRFEQVQKFTDDSLTECPVCHGRLRKVFNAVGVVFKGSGFYRNDSRSTTSGSDTASGSGSGGEKSSSDGSSEKSAPAAEKKTEKKSDSSSSTSSSGSTSAASTS
ncbi:FmdB family zinc ribbon protein [uncultured Nocardioides sp.]|uniref:FmdB family zinc ribbon protein n=1 Tax=uncultured Nocardioides sp. TaxID=198441 RepID=UPI002605A540|nr:FmdB family zinc ribbon protein [uncultured Nocardioides sp.]